jgi:predicted alpha/beta superfamily hydrolase
MILNKTLHILGLAIVLLSYTAVAESIDIGTVQHIESKILNEDRTYKVYLPEHYNDKRFPSQQYPVIYLLDGEKYFHVFSGIVKSMSKGLYSQIPESIVVAIQNTNRSLDLTPTKTEVPYPSGGAKNFESFIENELMPTINKKFRTLDFNILVGHSFGGLFALNTLLNNSELFNAYIVIDPSLWWNDGLLVKNYNERSSAIMAKRHVYFANANYHSEVNQTEQQIADFTQIKSNLVNLLSNAEENITFTYKLYNEDHGSIVLPALIDGLASTFYGFKNYPMALLGNPHLLNQRYTDLSNSLGFEFKPQAFYLSDLADMAVRSNVIIALDKLNKKYYPDNHYLAEKMVIHTSK